jgi:hypothetical protein
VTRHHNSTTELESVTYSFQGNLAEVKTRSMPVLRRDTPVVRGEIQEFSKNSRKRLLKLFARVDWENHKGIFLTLTYGAGFPNPRRAKQHIRAFIKRLETIARKEGRKVAYFWRLEFQNRGAPHFHMICIDLPYIDKKWLQTLWGSIIEYPSPFTRIEMLDSRKKAMRYLAKYLAKVSQTGGVSSGFNDVPYQAGGSLWESVGRFWGCEFRINIPYARLVSVTIIGEWKCYHDIKRAAKKVYPKLRSRYRQGFFLFSDNVEQWYRLLECYSELTREEIQSLN